MGWNPFKTVKKIVKKIGKGIKKIGKGLKKIMAKIAKPFAKLGPLGSIALGFMMPWAAGAIWNGITSWAGMAGTSFNLANLGTVGQALTSPTSNLLQKAVGYTIKGIHTAASGVKTAYQFVTDAIGGGIQRLTDTAKSIFGKNAEAGDLINDAVKNGPDIDVSILEENLAEKAAKSDLGVKLDVSKAIDTGTAVQEEVVEKSFFDKVKDKATKSALGAVGTSIEKAIVPDTTSELGDGVSYEPYNFLGDIPTYTRVNDNSTMLASSGYNWNGPIFDANMQSTDYGQSTYNQWMNSNYFGATVQRRGP